MNKKMVIITATCFVIIAAAFVAFFIVSTNREGNIRFSGTNSAMTSTRHHSGFAINAQRANGRARMHVNLTTENLENMNAVNSTAYGRMYLELTQGDVVRLTDISGMFNGGIYTSAFEPGRVTIRVIFERAEGVNFSIRW